MKIKHLYTTQAVVLNSIDYGESDLIVSFYTLDYGKLSGIAKGAKRSKKRFVNCLDPFSYVKLIFAQRQNDSLARIDQCELLDSFSGIRRNLNTIAVGSYFLELLSEMVREGQKNQKAFELILNFLKYLNIGKDAETFARFFEIKLLSILGYMPHLDKCVVCKNAPAENAKIHFSSAKGGIICQSCIKPYEPKMPICYGTARTLASAAGSSLEGLNRLSLSSHIKKECACIMDNFITYQLGKELKSKGFIKAGIC